MLLFQDENNEDSPSGGGIWSSNDGTGSARIGSGTGRIGGAIAEHWPAQNESTGATSSGVTGWGTQETPTVPQIASSWSTVPGLGPETSRNPLGVNPSIANAWGNAESNVLNSNQITGELNFLSKNRLFSFCNFIKI